MNETGKRVRRTLNYYVMIVCIIIYAVCIYRIVEAFT